MIDFYISDCSLLTLFYYVVRGMFKENCNMHWILWSLQWEEVGDLGEGLETPVSQVAVIWDPVSPRGSLVLAGAASAQCFCLPIACGS